MNKKVCVAIAMLLCTAVMAKKTTSWDMLDSTYSFDSYCAEFNKEYFDKNEYKMREKIFNQNMEEIIEHNQNQFNTYKMGVNHMTDYTDAEYKRLRGYKRTTPLKQTNAVLFSRNVEDLPSTVDWRIEGVVTPVKDQGQCGSCWSFAAAETVESHYAMAMGPLTILSEQQILDCTPNPNQCGGQGGCSGGTAELAYARIQELGGLSSEWQYPYLSGFGSDYDCKFNASKTVPVAVVTGYTSVKVNDYNSVLTAVATAGPLSIAADAAVWKNYETGVFTGCSVNTTDIDHAIQLVGYGTDTQYGDYWLVRNSWTPLWGEDGYIRIARSPDLCGVDMNPQDGSGCANGPSNVTVCGPCGLFYDVSYPTVRV